MRLQHHQDNFRLFLLSWGPRLLVPTLTPIVSFRKLFGLPNHRTVPNPTPAYFPVASFTILCSSTTHHPYHICHCFSSLDFWLPLFSLPGICHNRPSPTHCILFTPAYSLRLHSLSWLSYTHTHRVSFTSLYLLSHSRSPLMNLADYILILLSICLPPITRLQIS